MADKKTELMAQFYTECQQKGYTDMADDTQSLKAKVIATDLKLNYGNIKAFYERAKTCYEQVQAEKTETERMKAIQQQKAAQERARRQVDGELLVTLSDRAYESDETTSVRVYIRPDNSVYSTVNNGSKIEGAPKISIKQGGTLLLTYHPSQAVYTGATVGGITTGGVHYTQSGYTASKTHSGKGDIEISIGNKTFTLQLVEMSGHTCNLFKRDQQFRYLVHDQKIYCYVTSEKANIYYESIKTGRLDYQTMMNALSMAADEQRLDYAVCDRIANLIGRVVHGQFPPSDEQIYDSAKALVNASTSAELNRAVELYNSISDYKDSAKQAQATYTKYQEVLQAEKERAVLEKEAKAKKNKKMAAIVVPILVVLIVAAVIISNSAKKSNAYEFALSLAESGQYEAAIEQFAALGNYKDSAEQIHMIESTVLEEQRSKAYAEAIALLEAQKYNEAYAAFEALGDYKDSADYLEKFSKVYVLLSKSSSNGEITYEYADGVLIKETVVGKSSDGIGFQGFNFAKGTSGTAEYKYDAAGNCVEIRVYNDDGKLIKVTMWEYDSVGNISKETQEMPLHDSEDTYVYTYDDSGNVTLKLWYQNLTGTGDVYSKHSYEYDEHNQLISETTWYEWDIERTIVYENEYDSNGQLVKQSSLSLVNKYSETTEYEYDNNGNMIAQRATNDYGSWEYTYAYDEFGNMIREIYSGASGSPSRTTTYTYGYIYTFE